MASPRPIDQRLAQLYRLCQRRAALQREDARLAREIARLEQTTPQEN